MGAYKGSGIRNAGLVGGGGLLLAVGMIGNFEGLVTKTYLDVGGVLTYCYGETEGAVINAEYTEKQCKQLLENRVEQFYTAVDKAVTVPLPTKRAVALTSFTYNVGISAFQKSTLLKKLNAGDTRGACEQLDRWVYVGRMYVKGLANRRAVEKELCLDGLLEEV